MSYNPSNPPFTLKLRDMSKTGLDRYYQWFMDELPHRVSELKATVKLSSGFETWEADYTPVSLDTLGDWFASQIETRSRSRREVRSIQNRIGLPVDISHEQLTNRTFSLAMDVGMYFGQVLTKNHPTLRWEQPLNDKKFVDYGQPVLVGFSNAPLNPIRIAVVFAQSIASKKQTGSRLRELYNVWSNMV
jgi:hypothetical protein